MKKNLKQVSVMLLAAALVFAGCGSSSDSYKGNMADATYAESAAYASDDIYSYPEEAYEEADVTEGSDPVTVQDNSRKLIKDVNMSVETENMDTLIAKVNERVNAYNGYIESSYVYNGSGSYKSRSASIRARVPAQHLDAFLSNIGEVSNVTSQNLSVTDVTLQYVDVEAKRESLKTQQQRLLAFMEEAETVEDIIALEDRLSEIRYELDSAERQIRSYDNQVNYSTISLDVTEVVKYTPVKEPTRWEKLTEGFVESVYSVVEGILDFLVGFVIAIPYLLIWALVIFIIVIIIRAIIKSVKKKEEKKAMKRAQEYAARQAAMAQAQAQTNVKNDAQTQASTENDAQTKTGAEETN